MIPAYAIVTIESFQASTYWRKHSSPQSNGVVDRNAFDHRPHKAGYFNLGLALKDFFELPHFSTIKVMQRAVTIPVAPAWHDLKKLDPAGHNHRHVSFIALFIRLQVDLGEICAHHYTENRPIFKKHIPGSLPS